MRLLNDLSTAREMIDVNIATGVAAPRVRAFFQKVLLVFVLAVVFLAGAVYQSYSGTIDRLERAKAQRTEMYERILADQREADIERARMIGLLERWNDKMGPR